MKARRATTRATAPSPSRGGRSARAQRHSPGPDLDRFAHGDTDSRLDALRALAKARLLSGVAADPRLAAGLSALVITAAEGEVRVRIILALARALELTRVAVPAVEEALSSMLRSALPSLDTVQDAEDRSVLARSLRVADASWARDFLAHASVREKTSEKVRSASVSSLLSLVPQVGTGLRLLASAFRKAVLSQGDLGSPVRRLIRLLRTIRTELVKMEVEAVADTGGPVQDMVDAALRDSVQARKDRTQLIEEVARLLHELIKCRFTLSMEPATYDALSSLRSAMGDYEWERNAENSSALRMLGRDALEGLRLLAKTGSTDDRMLRALETIMGSGSEARLATSRMADDEHGLIESVRLWLLGQTPKRTSASAEDSRLLGLDGILADLTLENKSLREVAHHLRKDIAEELGVAAPRLAEQLTAMSDRTSAVASIVDLASRHRGMQVYGQVGESVDFVPAEHEVIGGADTGVRRVRIVKPGVLRHDGSLVRVVKKALVERT